MILWPTAPATAAVIHGLCETTVYEDSRGRPLLKLRFGDTEVYVTATVGELLGAVATGARQRWEDHHMRRL